MKALWLIAALSAWAAALTIQPRDADWVILVGGDVDGYLSPCGCSKPMSGGIRRRATAFRAFRNGDRTLVLENGGLVAGQERQDHLKAEALAEALKLMGADAINLGPSEARLGVGLVLAARQRSGERFLSTSLRPSPTNEVAQFLEKGPFLVGGASSSPESVALPLGESSVSLEDSVSRLAGDARARGLAPILMLQGNRERAVSTASKFPELALIVYRSAGAPPDSLERVGNTAIATPGEKGLHFLRLGFRDGIVTEYRAVRLDPTFADDPDVSRAYKSYLVAVDRERLLDKLPRVRREKFSGNAACGKCHPASYAVWKESAHSRALKTLERDGHGRDPDCVGCHVVGLDSLFGFRSRAKTPNLTDVGCESCHGPGAAHSASPYKVKMPRVGEKSCEPCHNPDHSPTFDFAVYWPKIAHQ